LRIKTTTKTQDSIKANQDLKMIQKSSSQATESGKPKGKLLLQDEIDYDEGSDVLETEVMKDRKPTSSLSK
jgi:hypothetical protein